MPHIHVRIPHATLDAGQKAELARRLTTDVLAAEGLEDTELQRSLCWVSIDETAPANWFVAGEPTDQRPELHAFVRVTTLAGLLTDEKRSAVHRAVNEAVVDAGGGDPLGGLGVWVAIEEVPDGSWGTAGNTIRQSALRHAVATAATPAA